jgi:hypothetical protein
MEAAPYSETSVAIYQSTPNNTSVPRTMCIFCLMIQRQQYLSTDGLDRPITTVWKPWLQVGLQMAACVGARVEKARCSE